MKFQRREVRAAGAPDRCGLWSSTGFALAALGALMSVSCSSGLGNNLGEEGETGAVTEAGLGMDLGFDLTDAIESDVDVVSALIPGTTERRISFVAFTTASANDNADGAGAFLSKDAQASDANGATDVFVMAVEDELGTRGQPTAFSRALVNTFRHSRCVQCHAIGSTPEPGERFVFPNNNTHPGPAQPILTDQCTSCHMAPNASPEVEWRAPRENNMQPFNMRNESIAELATRARSVPFEDHFLDDTRVTWAIESAVVPFVGIAGSSTVWNAPGYEDIEVGPVPVSMSDFTDQLLDWEDAGFPVTATDSIRDVALVSAASSGLSTGNGASSSPSMTWVPDPNFDPLNPSAIRAGQLVIAFTSTASDLTAGGTGTADIYTAALDVFVDRDPVNSTTLAGGVDIVTDPGANTLISAASGGGSANGPSSSASIDGSGQLVAFSSVATNLVAGFVDGNAGSSDVFLRDVGLDSTQLVSASTAGSTNGANGESTEPSLSAVGEAVSFSSLATDLTVEADTNSARDVFVTQRSGGAFSAVSLVSRPSLASESDGTSSAPDVAVDSGGSVSVVFQSDASNLADVSAGTSNVFLAEGGVLTLLSQVRTGGVSTPGDADSSAPRIDQAAGTAVYLTDATNLDLLQPLDENGFSDIISVDLAGVRSNDEVLGRRASLDSFGLDALAPSTAPRVSAFREIDGFYNPSTFVTFRTTAEDLGVTRQDLVSKFLVNLSANVTNFSADTTAGGAPLTVTFTDESTGAPEAWEWDFGDGSPVSNDQNPTHVYADVGNYTVSLTVSRGGEESSRTKADFIRALEPLAVTDLGEDVATGPEPLTVNFTPTITGSTEGATYSWDFGDGNTSTDAQPSHTYLTEGLYSVSLSVAGLSGSDNRTEPDLINVLPPSGANFTFGQTGLRTTFTDTSSGNPTSWFWDFGDGNTSTAQNPVHDYASNGSRLVTLTVNGPGGVSELTRTVVVNAMSFSTIYPYFNSQGCTGCHQGSSPAGGLNFTLSQASVYSNLVNVAAGGSSCAGSTRVVPFSEAGSLLVEIADPAIAACNNGANMGSWSPSPLADLRTWIEEGALD